MKSWHKALIAAGLVLAGVAFSNRIRAMPVIGAKIPSF